MKCKHLFLLIILFNTYCYSQSNCTEFWSENKSKIHLWLDKDSLFINQGSKAIAEDVVLVSSKIFKGKYWVKNDSLIVVSGKRKFIFRIIKDGILESTFKLNGYISKKDKFYCSHFSYKNKEFLIGSKWKNNQKDGDWIYRTKEDKLFRLTYKNGKLIRKEPVKTVETEQ
jgi:hypothetical protein